jgi:hypothetical protein
MDENVESSSVEKLLTASSSSFEAAVHGGGALPSFWLVISIGSASTPAVVTSMSLSIAAYDTYCAGGSASDVPCDEPKM